MMLNVTLLLAFTCTHYNLTLLPPTVSPTNLDGLQSATDGNRVVPAVIVFYPLTSSAVRPRGLFSNVFSSQSTNHLLDDSSAFSVVVNNKLCDYRKLQCKMKYPVSGLERQNCSMSWSILDVDFPSTSLLDSFLNRLLPINKTFTEECVMDTSSQTANDDDTENSPLDHVTGLVNGVPLQIFVGPSPLSNDNETSFQVNCHSPDLNPFNLPPKVIGGIVAGIIAFIVVIVLGIFIGKILKDRQNSEQE